MQQRLGTDPPLSDQSLGAYLLRLRDPKTGRPLPDKRLLPQVGIICEPHFTVGVLKPNLVLGVDVTQTECMGWHVLKQT